MLTAIDHVSRSAGRPKTDAELVMPQILSVPRVQRDDVAIGVPREHQSRCCRQHTGGGTGCKTEFPFAIAGQRVDRTEGAVPLVIARPCRAARLVLFSLYERLVERVVYGARLTRVHEKQTLRRIVRRGEEARPSTIIGIRPRTL